MSRIRHFAAALPAGFLLVAGLPAGAADAASTHAAAATVTARAVLAGELGFEGGAFPGGFHPTAGTVEVEFESVPLVLVKHVGASGHFRISLSPGTYDVTGCGPSSTGGTGQCSAPVTVTLAAGQVDHVKLVWAMVP